MRLFARTFLVFLCRVGYKLDALAQRSVTLTLINVPEKIKLERATFLSTRDIIQSETPKEGRQKEEVVALGGVHLIPSGGV